jgi:hypothetical protein
LSFLPIPASDPDATPPSAPHFGDQPETTALDRQLAQLVQAMAVFAVTDGGTTFTADPTASEPPLLVAGQG